MSRIQELQDRPWLTPFLGGLIAILAWNLTFLEPNVGVDPSWWAGISMAVHDGRQFGTEIIFTYGPLGYLRRPSLMYVDLGTTAFLYQTFLLVAYASALVWTFRTRFGTVLACLFSFLIIALLPMADLATPLALLWTFAVLSRRAPSQALTVMWTGGAVFAAIEALVKISSGPLIFAILLLGLIGARARPRQIATFVGIFAISFAVLWLAAGQHLSNLPDFVANSMQVISGFNEAMGTPGDSAGAVLLMVAVIPVTAIWAWFGEYRDRRGQIFAVVVALVIGFLAFKQGVVRADGPHKANYLGLMTIIWLAVPSIPKLRAGMAVGVAVFVIVGINVRGTDWSTRIDPVRNLGTFHHQVDLLVHPGQREFLEPYYKFSVALNYGLPPRMVEQLRGGTVSVDPWETSMAWVYDFDWSPLPVFQNYSAYTSRLDELNSHAVASAGGPDRIVRPDPESVDPLHPGGIDLRFPGWDPPGQMIATTCNFKPTGSWGGWQVLTRTGNRCDPPVESGVVSSHFGEPVDVPAPGPSQIIFVKVRGAEVHGLERLQTLLYKPTARYAQTSSGGRFRLVPGTAEDGLILRTGQNVGLGTTQNALVPQTDTLELTGRDGDLSFEFFRMNVHRKGQS